MSFTLLLTMTPLNIYTPSVCVTCLPTLAPVFWVQNGHLDFARDKMLLVGNKCNHVKSTGFF